MNRIIWITGASGFSARHLAAHLRRDQPGCRLVGLVRNPAQGIDLDVFHLADMTDKDALIRAAALDPPDVVYHLAGAFHPAPEEELWFVNVAGTRLLIEAVSGGPPRRIRLLVTSSAAVYRPTNVKVDERHPTGGANAYGRSKWGQEQVALAAGREFGVEVLIARAFNLIGPGLPDRLLAGAVCAHLRRQGHAAIKTGDLSAFRDLIDVRDTVEAYQVIAMKGRTGEIYNVCSGRPTRVRTMVRTLADLAGGREITEDVRSARKGVDRSWGDPSRLKALGWKSRHSLRRSLQDMFDAPPLSA